MSQDWEPPGQEPTGGEYGYGRSDPPPTPEAPPQAGYAPAPGYPSYTQQQPYAQPQAPPPYAQPYGQAYGQSPYGPPRPAHPAGPPPPRNTTFAAAVVQLVQSAAWVAAAVVLFVWSGDPLKYFDASTFDEETTVEDVRAGLIVGGVFDLMVVAAMLVLGIFVLRGVNGVRLASAIMQIVLGSFSLIGLIGFASDGEAVGIIVFALNTVACTLAAILLFLPSTVAYCRSRQAQRVPAGWPVPPVPPVPPGQTPY